MRRLLVLLAVLGMLSIGACKPTEPAGPDVSYPAPVVQEPEGSGDAEPAVEAEAMEPAAEPAESAAPEAEASAAATWDFEDAEAGAVPAGWSVAKTGEGPGGEWQVLEDESAPAGPKVLGQVSLEGPKPIYCLCVADETSYADVELSVQFKGVQGKIDQGGGPVWRFQDENNYYVARMNPLESNFRLYKVIDGERTKLASADVDIPDEDLDADDPLLNKWHTIRVVHRGDQIQCSLNGGPPLEFQDSSITSAGKIGLWVKADAVTSFDNLTAAAP